MGEQRRQHEHAGGDAFHGGLCQLARLLAAAIEEDQDLGRSTVKPTDPVGALLDTGIRQRGGRSTVSLSTVGADR